MDLTGRANLVPYHRHCLQACGAYSVTGRGWRSKDDRPDRFPAIAGGGGFDGRSVLEIDCGLVRQARRADTDAVLVDRDLAAMCQREVVADRRTGRAQG